jgi:predicted KAP-like P-loop ATPase
LRCPLRAVASILAQAGKVDGEAVTSVFKEQEKAEQEEHRETRRTVREFQRDFERLVAELGLNRLVVVVDDLDRCLPPNVIDTFEAIRLFLSVPNTAFIIAADEGVMRHAVASRFPSYEDAATDVGRRKVDVGGRYLEKFIHVPVRVPPLSPADLHGYLNLLFAEKHTTAPDRFPEFCEKVRQATAYDQVAFRAEDAEALLGDPPSEALLEDLALAARIAPVLALSAEGNPRQTKRFLNALLLRLEMAEARNVKLDRAVAAKLLLLEYFQPQLFADLARSAAAAGGRPPEIRMLEAEARGETVRRPEDDDGAGAEINEGGASAVCVGPSPEAAGESLVCIRSTTRRRGSSTLCVFHGGTLPWSEWWRRTSEPDRADGVVGSA